MRERAIELGQTLRTTGALEGGLLRTWLETETQVAATSGRVFVAVVSGQVSVDDVARGDALLTEFGRELGRPAVALVVVREGSEMLDRDAVVRRSIEIARAHRSDVAAIALVIGGGGFWASNARSAVNPAVTGARESYPTRFFARTQDACTFLLETLGDDAPSAIELADAVDALLRR